MILFDTFVVPPLSFVDKLMIGCLLLVSFIVVYRATIRLFSSTPLRLLLVLIANIFSVIAVIFLIIPIHLKQVENEKVVLLTNDYYQSLINKKESNQSDHSTVSFCQTNATMYLLTDASHVKEEVIEKDNSDTIIANNIDCETNFIEINHISELATLEPNLNQLDIYGDGLTSSQWQQVEPIKTQFYPSNLKSGFVNLQWRKQVTLGESVNFTAALQISRQSTRFDRIHTVQLIDVSGEILADVKVKHGDAFRFNFTPKTIGQHIYRIHLLEKSATDEKNTILIDDPIAVNVTESIVPKVLIIQSSPQYETKHFKHWLTEHNGKLLTLTQISKSHVMTEEVNMANDLSAYDNFSFTNKGKINSLDAMLTAVILDHFELLIIDAKALLSFESDTLALLENAVHNGLGVLINIDEVLIKSIESNKLALLSGFKQQSRISEESTNTENNNKQVRLNWFSNSSEHFIDANNIDLRSFSAKSIVFDQKKQPLVISNNFGKGKIALTTITSSFQLRLNGLYNEYSQFWQFMTSELASNKQQMFWLPQPYQEIIFKGDMVKACMLAEKELVKLSDVNSSQAKLPKVIQLNSQQDETILLLNSHATAQNEYCSAYFSNNAGWQQLLFSAENDNNHSLNKSQYIYHYAKRDWLAWQQSLTHSINAEKAKLSKLTSDNTINKEHSVPVNKLIAFLVLFICSSFLWIERKLS